MAQNLPWEADYRIPSDTRADHYDLYLHPNLDGDDFRGRVGIDVVAERPRDFFVVHVKYLTVTKTELKTGDGKSVGGNQCDQRRVFKRF